MEQRRSLQNSWHTTFNRGIAGYNTSRQSQIVDREVREPPAQGILPSGFEPDAEDQRVQQGIAGTDCRHEQHGSSNCAKIIPKSNVLSAISTGKSKKSVAVVEEIRNLRRDHQSWTRTSVTSPQFLAMFVRRTAVVVPNTDLLNDTRCTSRRNRCLKRPDRESTDAIQRYFHTWYAEEEYRKSLSATGWKEQHTRLYDRIAVEKQKWTDPGMTESQTRNSIRVLQNSRPDGR